MEKEKVETRVKYKLLDCKIKESWGVDMKEWLENKGNEGQEAVNKSNTKMLYHTVQEITGAISNTNALIKDNNDKIKKSKTCVG